MSRSIYDASGAPHDPLYNNHPNNLRAWFLMRSRVVGLHKAGITITTPALALWLERTYYEWLESRCITHEIVLAMAHDANRIPYYPLPYKR